jgi:hypothetical protein
MSSASKWDQGLDGDLLGEMPAPTADPYLTVNELYPDLPLGAAPLQYAPGQSKGRRVGMEGRLGRRQVRIPATSSEIMVFIYNRRI